MQPIRALRQVGGPGDAVIPDFAVGDDLPARHYFPSQRKCRGVIDLGPRRLTGTDHHRPGEKTVRNPLGQGIEDNFERNGISDMTMALTVDKFSLDSQFLSSVEKVHSARHLHATETRTAAKSSDFGI